MLCWEYINSDQFLIMESNKQTTLAQTKYLAPGTYLGQFYTSFKQCALPYIITTTLLAPLERWRIIAQTQKAYPLRARKFTSVLDYVRRIPKEQGVMAFWRGNTPLIWMYVYQTVLQIGIFDSIKQFNKRLNSQLTETPIATVLLDNIVFPLAASAISLAIIHPLDTYRIQLTMNYHKSGQEPDFNKFRHRAGQLQSKKLLYNGYLLANVISLINFNLYRNLYETFGNLGMQGQVPKQIWNKQLITAIIAAALVHPLDTLKKIYQLNNNHKPQLFYSYQSILSYMKQNKINMGLFNGFAASMTRTVLFMPLYWLIAGMWKQYTEGNGNRNEKAVA